MTEADLEREASRLYKQLGLKVGADSLDFFLVESVRLKDWKKLIKPPPLNNHIITNGNDWKMAEPNNAGIGMRPRHVKVRTDGRVVNGSNNSEDHKLKNNGDSNPESPPASFGKLNNLQYTVNFANNHRQCVCVSVCACACAHVYCTVALGCLIILVRCTNVNN